jgi:uncharacterized small protein (DUF1192 family)
MKIGDYSVAMNAQYYNLESNSTITSLLSNTKDFTNQDSSEVSAVEIEDKKITETNMQLSKELSKAILKNIYNQSQRVVGDKVEISTTYVESQELNFSTKAFVQADSKMMELSLDVSLSRSFVQKSSITMDLKHQLLDPLIISLDGSMPSVDSTTFSFDIDSDGDSEQISQLKSGNMFLALDKNSNGKIDNGNELFGTKSGDGFFDLSAYDDDKNGWIDENDVIFDKLRVWQKTQDHDRLIALGEVGIGAIFLGNTITPFSLKSQTNQLLGEIKKSGFVLFENASMGVISQVDLAIEDKTKESLDSLNSLAKNLINLEPIKIYKQDQSSQDPTSEVDEKIQKLKDEIKALELELKSQKDNDKQAIQAIKGTLYAQMISLLEGIVYKSI